MNLLVNAAQAIPEGAPQDNTLSIESRCEDAHVIVEVRDTGIGMSRDVLARVFDPFFSTKGQSGMGLGLAIVRAILASIGGQIAIESEPGRGTVVRVTLRRAQEGSDATDQTLPSARA
jgi:signal transduction histidine kinase